MPERLSSAWTPFYRTVFPILWIGGFGAGTAGLWLGYMDQPTPAPAEMKHTFLFVWVVGATFILWFVRRLREVALDGDVLLVNDAGEETSIPLHLVEEVTETRLWNPKMIRLRIVPRGGLPDQVVFLAPAALQLPFTDHPVVRRLRERMEACRSAQSERSGPATSLFRAEP